MVVVPCASRRLITSSAAPPLTAVTARVSMIVMVSVPPSPKTVVGPWAVRTVIVSLPALPWTVVMPWSAWRLIVSSPVLPSTVVSVVNEVESIAKVSPPVPRVTVSASSWL